MHPCGGRASTTALNQSSEIRQNTALSLLVFEVRGADLIQQGVMLTGNLGPVTPMRGRLRFCARPSLDEQLPRL